DVDWAFFEWGKDVRVKLIAVMVDPAYYDGIDLRGILPGRLEHNALELLMRECRVPVVDCNKNTSFIATGCSSHGFELLSRMFDRSLGRACHNVEVTALAIRVELHGIQDYNWTTRLSHTKERGNFAATAIFLKPLLFDKLKFKECVIKFIIGVRIILNARVLD